MISFILVGLWHGANWNFIIFGLLHGAAQSYEVLTKKFRIRYFHRIPKKIYSLICLFVTFSFVNITMVFFRANNLTDAFYVVTHMFSGLSFDLPATPLFNGTDYVIAVVMLIMLELVQSAQTRIDLVTFLAGQKRTIRWAAYYAIIFLIIMFGVFTKNQFVYFQF
jgi:D-alanyl-lipoteichoic acid acyltransferase DltB (MBOAT superfamily)